MFPMGCAQPATKHDGVPGRGRTQGSSTLAPELPSAWLTPSGDCPAIQDSCYLTSPSWGSDMQQSEGSPCLRRPHLFPFAGIVLSRSLNISPGPVPASPGMCTNTGPTTLLFFKVGFAHSWWFPGWSHMGSPIRAT